MCACVRVGGRYALYWDLGAVQCEVEADGDIVLTEAGPAPAAAVDHAAFLHAPDASVTLARLAPGMRYQLRYRCVATAPVVPPVRWALPWSPPVTVATLRPPRHAAAEHPPEVVHVACTFVTLRVRNPGAGCGLVR